MSARTYSEQMMKKSNNLIFLNKEKLSFKNCLPWQHTHSSQNARINTSVVNLDSCKKMGAKA